MSRQLGKLLAFPKAHRRRGRSGSQAILGTYIETEALLRAEARLLWTFAGLSLLMVSALRVLAAL